MRLIHTIPSIANEASGPSYSVRCLCDSLIEQNIDLVLAALKSPTSVGGLNFLKEFPLGVGPKRLGSSPEMYKWLDLQAREGLVDLLHNHSLWMMPNVYPGQMAKRYGVPYVVSPRGVFTKYAMSIGSKIKKVFWPLIQKPSLEAVTLFHATAEAELEDIRRMGYRQDVAVIPNGIAVPEPLMRSHNATRQLLFLGRIHPNKGLDMLLHAWKSVEARFCDWELVVVGPDEGGYLNRVIKASKDLKIKRIRFLGGKYGNQKWQAYADADLFILPSYSENFGMSVAEALASGTPAIVTKGAPWEGLLANEAGWWVETDFNALVACLEVALSKSMNELSLMGKRGREWMIRDYSWGKIGSKMAKTYDWLLSGGAKPPWIYEY